MSATFKPEDTRPFNLENARAGAPICMRNGDPVTVIKWDMNNQFSIIATFVEESIEWVGTWYPDGSYSKNEEGDLPNDLVMKPIDYIDGRPVHVGDVLIHGKHQGKPTPEHEFSFVVGPEMNQRLLDCFWPYVESYEDEPGQDAKPEPEIVYAEPIPDRVIDSLIPSGLRVHSSAYGLLYEFAQNVNNEAFARFPRATNPDAITLTKSDIQHVVWAYMQLAENSFRLDSAEHVKALREIAVKHGGLMEAAGIAFPSNVGVSSIPVFGDGDDSRFPEPIGPSIAKLVEDGCLPAEPPESFQDVVTDLDQKVKEACSVPAELLKSDDDPAETAYWIFDARVKGYSEWKGRPQSERDAFKAEYRKLLAVVEDMQNEITKRDIDAAKKLKAPVEPVVVDTSKAPPSLHGGYVLRRDVPEDIKTARASNGDISAEAIETAIATVKHGGMKEGKGTGELAFIDDILPENFPVKFAEPSNVASDQPNLIKVALKKSLDMMKDEDRAETAWNKYWAMVNPTALIPQTPRYAFKSLFNEALDLSDYWQKQCMQQAEQIRKLTEANTALENLNRSYLEDNAKMDKMLDEQMTETGRWMSEAKKLGDEVASLNAKLDTGGFIPWFGGTCPVQGKLTVVAILRDGSGVRRNADVLRWDYNHKTTTNSDVIAYKVAD